MLESECEDGGTQNYIISFSCDVETRLTNTVKF